VENEIDGRYVAERHVRVEIESDDDHYVARDE
jgi:hypothetical protein